MPAQSTDNLLPPARYEGLDSFRVLGIYVVVMAHFHDAWAPQVSLGKIVYWRGCAFPIVILTSFFVLSRSVLTKPDRGFGRFIKTRFKRIEMPFLIWTVIYWVITGVVFPLRYGAPIAWPAPTLLLSGYMHLWFLQFIFLGSIILYPLLVFFASRERLRWRFAVSCLVAALAYAVWARPFLVHSIQVGMAQADPSLQVFADHISNYGVYVPAALGLALCAARIEALYARPVYRMLSLLTVAGALWMHLALNDSFPFTKGLYSLAVFVALLQPLPAVVVNALRPIATYSYPIYIIHYLVSYIVAYKIFRRAPVAATPGKILLGSLFVFGLSLLASVALRKLFPHDWFLPLIPIKRRRRGAERSQRTSGNLRIASERVNP